MIRLLTPLFLTILLFTAACSDKTGVPGSTAAIEPKKLGVDSISANFIEQDAFNIAYWTELGVSGRKLVRLSGVDGLSPVPDDALAKIRALAAKGDFAGLRAAGDGTAERPLYDASSFLYVANALGLVSEVLWVMPTFTSVDINRLDSYKEYLKRMYPESADDIDAMTLAGGVAKGRLNGVAFRMLGLDDLEDPGEPVLVDIDSSFFQAMYVDEKQTSSLSFVAGLFDLLSSAGLSAEAVSISASNADGMASFRLRAFARYIERLLMEPGLIDSDPPELWKERKEAWRAEQNDPEIAIPIYKRIISAFPEDAASRYDLADLYFRQGDLESCAVELEAASRLDRGYLAAYTDYSNRLIATGEPDIAARFYLKRPEL